MKKENRFKELLKNLDWLKGIIFMIASVVGWLGYDLRDQVKKDSVVTQEIAVLQFNMDEKLHDINQRVNYLQESVNELNGHKHNANECCP